jgi:hypothetical protein
MVQYKMFMSVSINGWTIQASHVLLDSLEDDDLPDILVVVWPDFHETQGVVYNEVLIRVGLAVK